MCYWDFVREFPPTNSDEIAVAWFSGPPQLTDGQKGIVIAASVASAVLLASIALVTFCLIGRDVVEEAAAGTTIAATAGPTAAPTPAAATAVAAYQPPAAFAQFSSPSYPAFWYQGAPRQPRGVLRYAYT